MRSPLPFEHMPAPRCCELTSSSPLVVCNRPARWMPLIDRPGLTPFWCELHKSETAVPIAGVTVVRRVSVVSQIILGSAVELDELARAEAVARLIRGVLNVGGLMNLHTVTCQTGNWRPPAVAGSQNGNGGGR